MTSQVSNYSYSALAKLYLKGEKAVSGLVPIGNCSGFKLQINEEVKKLTDYSNLAGGLAATSRFIKDVTGSLIVHDYDPTNLARASFGGTRSVTAGTVSSTPEEVKVYLGELTLLANRDISSVVVKEKAESNPKTYVAGTDYLVQNNGIVALAGGDIGDGDSVEVTYSFGGIDIMEALTGSAAIFQLYIEAGNLADSARPFWFNAPRVQFGPAKEISLIGTDFGQLEFAFDVLKDASITTSGHSQFFTISQQS
jgi:hypothetical protein